MRAEHSRALRLAASASGEPESRLERRLGRAVSTILLDPELPGALEMAAILIETLARGPGRVELDPSGLGAAQIERLLGQARAIAGSGAIGTGEGRPDAITLRIAAQGPPGAVRVIADGHGVRLSRCGGCLGQRREPSALGVMMAAALAAGEIFKAAAGVDPSRCVIPDELAFCPVSLSEDLQAAALEVGGPIDLGLIGLGAIGTAVARILAGLGFERPSALLIDPERYEIENLGTYSLGTPADVAAARSKVELAARTLGSWRITRHRGAVGKVPGLIDAGELPWPRIVLAGLDSVEARHAAQGLWPDRLIDAATGDTAVGLSDAVSEGPCLRCFFARAEGDESAAAALAREFGLPIDLVMRGERRLELDQLERLPAAQRARLLPHLGKPICGLASALGLGAEKEENYRPSVPFVSQQAACLAVGRLLAHRAGMKGLPNAVQYNTMFGPQQMTRLWRAPRPGCRCQQRTEVIMAVRAARGAGAKMLPSSTP